MKRQDDDDGDGGGQGETIVVVVVLLAVQLVVQLVVQVRELLLKQHERVTRPINLNLRYDKTEQNLIELDLKEFDGLKSQAASYAKLFSSTASHLLTAALVAAAAAA